MTCLIEGVFLAAEVKGCGESYFIIDDNFREDDWGIDLFGIPISCTASKNIIKEKLFKL